MKILSDNIKVSRKLENYTLKELSSAVTVHVLVSLVSAFTCRGVVLGKFMPFGIAFLGGCNGYFLPASMVGAFISYFIPATDVSGFRYIAALFAVLSIKLLLTGYKKIVNNSLFCALISFLACTLTGFTALSTGQADVLSIITEGLLCGMASFFICKTFRSFEREVAGFSSEELASLLLTCGIVIMGLYSFEVLGVSLGRILGVLIILIASKYGGIIAGSISGITIGFSLLLNGSGGTIGLTFALSGLMCGVFANLGKYAQIMILVVLSFIGGVISGEVTHVANILSESVIGSILFVIIPKNIGIGFGKVFSSYPKMTSCEGIKKSLTMRLNLASNALKDVSETVEQVSQKLAQINSPDFSKVIYNIEQEACAGCKLRVHCWESRRKSTVDAIMDITKAIKNNENNIDGAIPEEFKGRCLRVSKISNVTFRKYSEYASRISAENRLDEVRSVVSDQFNGISDMLSDLGEDFKNDEHFDNVMAENVASAFKDLDIRVSEAGCRIDKFGRITLEFKLKKDSDLVINKMKVMKIASIVCERNFDVPNVSEVGGEIFIVLNEKADITIDYGAEQICANDAKMCGDAYKCFNDGRGHFLMVLSDGMGTGGRAAVDGAMACGLMSRLVKAGFGFDCSLRFLNSSMLFKSTDESLATVDVASIDLFTGQTELYKAGAAPTIIRRSGRTGKAESTSLPAGILRDIGFDKASIKCKVGDIVVMMSDGAVSEGLDWIREEIEIWTDGTAQSLAERLCECAKRRRTDAHEDDITVLTAILNKSV